MPRFAALVSVFVLLFSSGAALAQGVASDLIPDPIFKGEITPIEEPILLRNEPFASTKFDVLTTVMDEANPAEGGSFLFFGSLEAARDGDGLEVSAEFNTSIRSTDRNELEGALLPGVMRARIMGVGANQKIEMKSAGAPGRARAVGLGMEAVVDLLWPPLPESRVEQGTILPFDRKLVEESSISFEEFSESIVGESVILGRASYQGRSVVIKVTNATLKTRRAEAALSAYTLFDRATGLAVLSEIVVRDARVGEPPFRARFGVQTGSTTPIGLKAGLVAHLIPDPSFKGLVTPISMPVRLRYSAFSKRRVEMLADSLIKPLRTTSGGSGSIEGRQSDQGIEVEVEVDLLHTMDDGRRTPSRQDIDYDYRGALNTAGERLDERGRSTTPDVSIGILPILPKQPFADDFGFRAPIAATTMSELSIIMGSPVRDIFVDHRVVGESMYGGQRVVVVVLRSVIEEEGFVGIAGGYNLIDVDTGLPVLSEASVVGWFDGSIQAARSETRIGEPIQ